MQTIASGMHTNVECTWTWQRPSVGFEISRLVAEQAAALSIIEDSVGLVSEFPRNFLEYLEPPAE